MENFPNMGKEIVTQVQELQRVPYKINPRRNTPRHILIKLTKIKCKEKILKTGREKQKITYKGIPIRDFSADFSAETLQARREWQDILKVIKENNLQPRLPSKDLIQIQGRNQKLYRQEEAKRIQHNQTSSTTNAKGTSLSGKHKKRKDLQKQTQRDFPGGTKPACHNYGNPQAKSPCSAMKSNPCSPQLEKAHAQQ